MKIVSVVGASPQFVKAATVSRELRAVEGVREVLIHTGQHYDAGMSHVFFDELDIPTPDYNLSIGSGSHGWQTGRMLEEIEKVILRETPDWIVVYGDTNSTIAGALSGAKLHIPVAHIEAGLRSFNRRMPEEVNRILTDHASTLLLAPTAAAVVNLRKEGINEGQIRLVGDVMYDAAIYYAEKASGREFILQDLGVKPKEYALATVHRAENTDDPDRLDRIFRGLIELNKEIPVILPMHPRTRQALKKIGALEKVEENLKVIKPAGYLDMVTLEKNALLIATDSGGVQKEAFFYRVPCVTLREETEWVELVHMGWNKLCSPTVSDFVLNMVELAGGFEPPDHWEACYGEGRASLKVTQAILGT